MMASTASARKTDLPPQRLEEPPLEAVSLQTTLSNSMALVVCDLVAKVLPLVTFPLVVRALGPEAYGKLGFASAVVGFFALAASPGFTVYARREAARDPAAIPRLAQSLVGARLLFALFSYALLVLFSVTVAPSDAIVRSLLLLSGLSMLVSSVDLSWAFAGRSRMWVVAVTGIAGQLVYAAIIVSSIRSPEDSWIIPVAAAAALGVAATLVAVRARFDYRISWPVLKPSAWKPILPASLVLGSASAMSVIYDRVDVVMLRYFRTDAEVGLYAASYKLMGLALSFLPILGQVFFSLISEVAARHPERERQYLKWAGTAAIGLALPIAAGGAFLAAPLALFVLGPQYIGGGTLVRWLMLNVIAATLASYYSGRLVPHGRERQYLVAVACGAAANVVLNALYIPRYGALAAALTTAVAQAVVAGVAGYLGRDLVQPQLGRGIATAAVATVAMAAGLWAVRANFDLHVSVLVSVGFVVFAAAYSLATLVAQAWLPEHEGAPLRVP